MENYSLILGVTGLLNLVAFIWLVIVGFKRSILWGILIFLFSPLSAIIFALTNWFDAKKAFLAYLVTSIAFVVALFMFAQEHGSELKEISEAVESGRIAPNEAAEYLGNTDQLPGNEAEAGLDPDMIVGDEVIVPGDETAPVDGAPVEDPASAASVAGSEKTVATGEQAAEAAQEAPAKQEVATKAEAVVEEDKPSPYPSLDKVRPDPLIAKKKIEDKNTTRVGVNKLKSYIGRYFEVTKKDGTKHRGILIKVTKSRIVLERKIYSGSFTYKVRKTQIKRADMFKKEYVEEIS